MDREIFVQNVKSICQKRGLTPTAACKNAGVSASFLVNIANKGQTPSVDNVQKLAAYLGTTVSALIGEEKPAAEDGSGSLSEFARLYAGLSAENRNKIIAEMLRLQRGQ